MRAVFCTQKAQAEVQLLKNWFGGRQYCQPERNLAWRLVLVRSLSTGRAASIAAMRLLYHGKTCRTSLESPTCGFYCKPKIWEGTVSCGTHATKQLKVAEGTAALGITVLPKPAETNLQKPLTLGKGKHWKQIASGLLSYSLEAGFLWDKENCCGVQGLFLTSLYLRLPRDFSSNLQKEPSPLSGPSSLRLH